MWLRFNFPIFNYITHYLALMFLNHLQKLRIMDLCTCNLYIFRNSVSSNLYMYWNPVSSNLYSFKTPPQVTFTLKNLASSNLTQEIVSDNMYTCRNPVSQTLYIFRTLSRVTWTLTGILLQVICPLKKIYTFAGITIHGPLNIFRNSISSKLHIT